MNQHQHELEYEFAEGRFPNGWRGDMWCKNCNYVVYSREVKRMEMFGLVRNVNPPQKNEKYGPSTDKAMFKINNLIVEKDK